MLSGRSQASACAMRSRAPAWRGCSCAAALVAALVALLLATPTPAGAATSTNGTAGAATPASGMFSITPARRYVVARPPVSLVPSSVSNGTESALEVEAVPVILGQDSSGAFDFGLGATEVRAAASLLRATPSHFRLQPGATQEVRLRWRRLSPGARTANIGVIYQAVPPSSAGRVRVVEQLLNVNLLRLPGRYRMSGALTRLDVTQEPHRVLRFGLDAKNTGQAFASPRRLYLRVYRDGRRVLSRRLTPGVVLPEATREFVLDLRHQLPAGSYRAVASMSFGSSRRLRKHAYFRLSSPGELPSPDLRVGPLRAEGSAGGHAIVSAAVRNSGTAAGGTNIHLALYRLSGGAPSSAPVAAGHLTVTDLTPSRVTDLHGALGELDAGAYQLVATYESSERAPQKLVADFDATAGLSVFAQLTRFSRDHAVLIPLLLLLLALICMALAVALLLRQRKLTRSPAGAHRRILEAGPPARGRRPAAAALRWLLLALGVATAGLFALSAGRRGRGSSGAR